jgi:murein DD-endopeptidase MepM/ murein hydrolase activator NlpD
VLPAKGRLATPFGVRRLRNGRPVGRHRGMDIAGPTGTPIMAPAGGRVMLALPPGTLKKYGGIVVLDHGQGLTSLYMHMSAVTARKGQVLSQGAPLGKVGATGVATGPHLHWAVYVHGDSVQPAFFTKPEPAGGADVAGHPS